MARLRTHLIRLATQRPEFRPLLLPILLEGTKVAAVKTETYNGTRFRWKQQKRGRGMRGAGEAHQKYASWTLANDTYPGVFIVKVAHSYDVMSYMPRPEEPYWYAVVRIPMVTEEDRAQYGSSRDFRLKTKFPAPEGSDDTTELHKAMDFAFRSFLAEMAKRTPPTTP